MGVKLGVAVDFCFLAYDPESDQDEAITSSLNIESKYIYLQSSEKENVVWKTWCTLINLHYNSLLLSNTQ